jgi:hypothetical protein
MNDKDKEAFEKWIDNDVLSQDETALFKNMSEQERVVFVTERTWQAACEYMKDEVEHRDDLIYELEQNYLVEKENKEKLQAENKKLCVNNVLLENKVRQYQSVILDLQKRILLFGDELTKEELKEIDDK